VATPRSAGSKQKVNTSSKVFSDLKDTREKIQGNLTTAQYLRTYDILLYTAMRGIVEHTNFFDTYLIRLLGWQEVNHRRKVSFLKRTELPRLVINFLLQDTPEARFIAIKQLKLDRGLRVEIIRAFVASLSKYLACCNLNSELSLAESIEYKAQVEKEYNYPDLYKLCVESSLWLDRALEFKSMIQEKYIRLCLVTAQRDHATFFSGSIDLDDVIHTYFIACSRAIDKCDGDAGTLTTHIQNWFFTARESVWGQKNKTKQVSMDAFLQRQESTDYGEGLDDVDEDDVTVHSREQELEHDHEARQMSALAKIADPHGAARLLLGIPEFLTEAELKKLNKLVKE
jgi:hypothetical protein